MPTSLGPAEIMVILVVALIVLGPKRLPEAGRQVGKALAEVRRWSQGFQSEVRNVLETEPAEAKPTPEAKPAPDTKPADPPATSTLPADPPTS